jgi:hypothetical protein
LAQRAAHRGNRCRCKGRANGCAIGEGRAAGAARERLDAKGGNNDAHQHLRAGAPQEAHWNLPPAIEANLAQRNSTHGKENTIRTSYSMEVTRIKLRIRFVARLPL